MNTLVNLFTFQDKMFELELSWVTESTNGKHEKVPVAVQESAEKFAKESLEDDSDDSGDEM
jgi:20S proteasome subunit alpha 7